MNKSQARQQPTSPQGKNTYTHDYPNSHYQQSHPYHHQNTAQYHYNNPQYWQYQYQQPPVDQQQAQYYTQPNYSHPIVPNVITNVIPSPAQTQCYANRVVPCFIQSTDEVPYFGQSKTDSVGVDKGHENVSTENDDTLRYSGKAYKTTYIGHSNKPKKIHLFLHIFVAIISLFILGIGLFAIFNPFNENNNLNTMSTSQNMSAEKKDRIIEEQLPTSKLSEQQPLAQVNHEPKTFSAGNTRPTRSTFTTATRPRARRRYIPLNRIILTSYPTGALITANGRVMGRTPYTWNNPELYGMIELTAEKEGYSRGNNKIEFTGGTIRKHFNLRKKQPEYKTAAVTNVQNDRRVAYTTPPAQTANATTKVAQKQASPKPMVQTGTIFLSSIPPYADVYMNGKKIGKTNTDHIQVACGSHILKFVKGSKNLSKNFTFLPGVNPSQLVRLK